MQTLDTPREIISSDAINTNNAIVRNHGHLQRNQDAITL